MESTHLERSSDISDPFLEEEKDVWKKADVLTPKQIKHCLREIEDLHPLRDKVQFSHIVPVCKKCIPTKPNFRDELRKCILSELQMKMPKAERMYCDDPFLLAGFGINSYFDIMRSLGLMFLCMSVMMSPAFYSCTSNRQLALATEPHYAINMLTLGNLGGSHVNCDLKKLEFEEVNMQCLSGRIQTAGAQFGVMSDQIDHQIYCQQSSLDAFIKDGYDKQYKNKKPQPYQNCSAYIDQEYVRNSFVSGPLKERCENNTICSIELDIDKFYSGKKAPEVCYGQAMLFVQYRCLIPVHLTTQRQLYSL
jgi:hypothetical protein